jgi:hypothetical protein
MFLQLYPSLNLPPYVLKYRTEGQITQIFDKWRKKYVVLTPEEWVRQHLVNFLVSEKKFPSSLIVLEGGLKLNGLQKRSDVVVYNTKGEPILIVECKAPGVKISQETFDQITRYNMTLKVDYLLVSNGLDHYCCRMDYLQKGYTFLKEVPLFDDL